MDVAHAEAVEKDLNNFIERRSRKGDVDPEEREELWKESVRAYTARRQEENRQAWMAFHEGQALRHRRTLEDLIARHEAEAERLAP
jgi:hypothetical protein